MDIVLYVAFPYLAVAIAVVVSIQRYRSNRFTYSSYSSQLMENRALFWGSVAWHYGIILILTAHLLAFLFPRLWGDLLADSTRLYILEVTGLALAALTIVGLLVLVVRRLTDLRAFVATSVMDWILLFTLLTQVIFGFWIALVYRWGSGWYLHTAVPWLQSLLLLRPEIQYVTALPWPVQTHLLLGFFLILLFPFTRLVHVVVYPITYLWRPLQVVIWNRRPSQQA